MISRIAGWSSQQGPDREAAMQRTRVSSSSIVSIGYDASSQVLEVQFRSGSVYQYSDVRSIGR
jgi:hypothetical protein